MSELTLPELADRAGITPRTIRYYIQIGLLPSPGTSGPGPHYDESYLDRVRLIKRLQRAHMPLAEIRKQLAEIDDQAVHGLVQSFQQVKSGQVSESALSYVRPLLAASLPRDLASIEPPEVPLQPTHSQWDRIALSPDIEVHVQRPLSRRTNRVLDEIIRHAQRLFEEDDP
jgi:DNA-binding transcriptional MerR regulator